jgi:aminomethyltransferase
MPVQYDSAVKEHHAVRRAVGLFDVSHMGQIEFRGTGAEEMVQWITCNDVKRLSDGQAQYSALLTEEGTFVDDVVVYRLNQEHFLLCVNAATKEKDYAWVQDQRRGKSEIIDRSEDYSQLAVQGPKAEETLQKLTDSPLGSILFYHFAQVEVVDRQAIVSRTGYTGEDGFEIYCDPIDAETIWLALLEGGKEFGVKPAGLAARNTLRLEVRYALYGNDIDDTRTPLEAGLGWIVKLDTEFVGRSALVLQKETGVEQKLVGFEMVERGIARDGYEARVGGHLVGTVSSGGFSPTLEKSIGLIYVPVDVASPEQGLEINIRGRNRKAKIVKTPFYKSSHKFGS